MLDKDLLDILACPDCKSAVAEQEGKVIGYEDGKVNPGNGVNVSHLLYMIDRMMGITPRGETIEIAPESTEGYNARK